MKKEILEREAATDGYSLLGKLSLPRIRVDEVMRTIVPLTNNGSVQLRLNGTLASKEDLLSLDPKLVKNIDSSIIREFDMVTE